MAKAKKGKQPPPMLGNDIRAIEMTLEQANWLFRMSVGVIIPEPLCEQRKIEKDELPLAKHETDALWAELYEQSPVAQERKDDGRVMIFGRRTHIKEVQKKGKSSFDYKDETTRVNVTLSSVAIRGICWILFIHLHPPVMTKEGKVATASVSAVQAYDICWPIARAIRRESAIRDLLGLDQARKERWTKSDPPKKAAKESVA